jgi:aspartate kinase
MNPIVVHKYGGSSLADLDRIRAVAARIVDTVRGGKRVVAVVSAMGGTTDELLDRAKAVSDNPNHRELDMLLSVGERISTALLAIAIDDLGVPAVSFTGSQSGIITNARHNRARIIEVRPYRLVDELDAGRVVVVAGYQGVSYAREITTLGRGGTDTTAVALAAALEAEYCEILSDVDGVYTADPCIVEDARRLDTISHDEMLALSRHGARVLNKDCVEYASRHGVALFAKAAFGPKDDSGTVVRVNPSRGDAAVTAIAHRKRVCELLLGPEGEAERLLEDLNAAGASPETMEGGGDLPLRITFPLEDTHGLEALSERLQTSHGAALQSRTDRGSVTVVGNGLGEEGDLVRRSIAIVREITGAATPVSLGPLALTFTLPYGEIEEAVARLHRELLGP